MLVQHLANRTNYVSSTIGVTTQKGEINYKKPKVIAFVVNADMNITANNFLNVSCFIKLKFCWMNIRNILAYSGLSMVNMSMSSSYRDISLNLSMWSNRLDF